MSRRIILLIGPTDGDLLLGSVSAGYQFSRTLFAYDVRSGALKWRYDSPVMRNSTFAVESGKIFLVEHRGQTAAPRVMVVAGCCGSFETIAVLLQKQTAHAAQSRISHLRNEIRDRLKIRALAIASFFVAVLGWYRK